MELHHLLSLGDAFIEGRSNKNALNRRIECIATVAKKVATLNTTNTISQFNLNGGASGGAQAAGLVSGLDRPSPNASVAYGNNSSAAAAAGGGGGGGASSSTAGAATANMIRAAAESFDALVHNRASMDTTIAKVVMDHPASATTFIHPEMVLGPRDRFLSYVYCGMSDGSVTQYAAVLCLVATSDGSESMTSEGVHVDDYFRAFGPLSSENNNGGAGLTMTTSANFSQNTATMSHFGGGAASSSSSSRVQLPADASSVLDKTYLHHIAPYRHKVSFQELFTSPLIDGEGPVTFLQHINPTEASGGGASAFGAGNDGAGEGGQERQSNVVAGKSMTSGAAGRTVQPRLIALRGNKLLMLNSTTFTVEPTFKDFGPLDGGVSLCCVASPAPTSRLAPSGEPEILDALFNGSGGTNAEGSPSSSAAASASPSPSSPAAGTNQAPVVCGKVAAIVKRVVVCMTFVGNQCYSYHGSGITSEDRMLAKLKRAGKLVGVDADPLDETMSGNRGGGGAGDDPGSPMSGNGSDEQQFQQPIIAPENTSQLVWHRDSIILGTPKEYLVFHAKTGHLLDLISIDKSLIRQDLAATGLLPSLSMLPDYFDLKWMTGLGERNASAAVGGDGAQLAIEGITGGGSANTEVAVTAGGAPSISTNTGGGGGAVTIRQPNLTVYDAKNQRPVEDAKLFSLRDGEECYELAFNFPFMSGYSVSGPDLRVKFHEFQQQMIAEYAKSSALHSSSSKQHRQHHSHHQTVVGGGGGGLNTSVEDTTIDGTSSTMAATAATVLRTNPTAQQLQQQFISTAVMSHAISHIGLTSVLSNNQQAPFVLPLPCYVNTRNASAALPKHPLTASNSMTLTSPLAGQIALQQSQSQSQTQATLSIINQRRSDDSTSGGALSQLFAPTPFSRFINSPSLKLLDNHLHQPNLEAAVNNDLSLSPGRSGGAAAGGVGGGGLTSQVVFASPPDGRGARSQSVMGGGGAEFGRTVSGGMGGGSTTMANFSRVAPHLRRKYHNVNGPNYVQYPMIMSRQASVPMATFFTVAAASVPTAAGMSEYGSAFGGALQQMLSEGSGGDGMGGIGSGDSATNTNSSSNHAHSVTYQQASVANNRDLFVAIPLPTITVTLQMALSGAYEDAIQHFRATFPYFPSSSSSAPGPQQQGTAQRGGGGGSSVTNASVAFNNASSGQPTPVASPMLNNTSVAFGKHSSPLFSPSMGGGGVGAGGGGASNVSGGGGGIGIASSAPSAVVSPHLAAVLRTHSISYSVKTIADLMYAYDTAPWVEFTAGERLHVALCHLHVVCGCAAWQHRKYTTAIQYLMTATEMAGCAIVAPSVLMEALPELKRRPQEQEDPSAFGVGGGESSAMPSSISVAALSSAAKSGGGAKTFTPEELSKMLLYPTTLANLGKHACTQLAKLLSLLRRIAFAGQHFCVEVILQTQHEQQQQQHYHNASPFGAGSHNNKPASGGGNSRLNNRSLGSPATSFAHNNHSATPTSPLSSGGAPSPSSAAASSPAALLSNKHATLQWLKAFRRDLATIDYALFYLMLADFAQFTSTDASALFFPTTALVYSECKALLDQVSAEAKRIRASSTAATATDGGGLAGRTSSGIERNSDGVFQTSNPASGQISRKESLLAHFKHRTSSIQQQQQQQENATNSDPALMAQSTPSPTAAAAAETQSSAAESIAQSLVVRVARYESMLMAANGMLKEALSLCKRHKLVAEAVVPLLWSCYPDRHKQQQQVNSNSQEGGRRRGEGTADGSTTEPSSGTAAAVDPIGLFSEHLPWMLRADPIIAVRALSASASSSSSPYSSNTAASLLSSADSIGAVSSLSIQAMVTIDSVAISLLKQQENEDGGGGPFGAAGAGDHFNNNNNNDGAFLTPSTSMGHFGGTNDLQYEASGFLPNFHEDALAGRPQSGGGGGGGGSVVAVGSSASSFFQPFLFSPPPHNAIIPVFLQNGFRGAPLFDYLKFLIEERGVSDSSVHTLHAMNLIEMVGIVARAVFAPAGEVFFENGDEDDAEDENDGEVGITISIDDGLVDDRGAKAKPNHSTNPQQQRNDWKTLLAQTTVRFADDALMQTAGTETGILGPLRNALLRYLQLPTARYDADLVLCRLSNCAAPGWWLAPSVIETGGANTNPRANPYFPTNAATAYLSAPRLNEILDVLAKEVDGLNSTKTNSTTFNKNASSSSSVNVLECIPTSRTHIALLPETAAVQLHMGDETAMLSTLVYGLNAVDMAEQYCCAAGLAHSSLSAFNTTTTTNATGSNVVVNDSSNNFLGPDTAAKGGQRKSVLISSAAGGPRASVIGGSEGGIGDFFAGNSQPIPVAQLLFCATTNTAASSPSPLSTTLQFLFKNTAATMMTEQSNGSATPQRPSTMNQVGNAATSSVAAPTMTTADLLGNPTAAADSSEAIFDGSPLPADSPLLSNSTFNAHLLKLLRVLVFPPLKCTIPGALETMMPLADDDEGDDHDELGGGAAATRAAVAASNNSAGLLSVSNTPQRQVYTTTSTNRNTDLMLAANDPLKRNALMSNSKKKKTSPTFNKRIEEALELLERHAESLDPVEVLSILPTDMPVAAISQFLKRTFQANNHKKRLLQVISKASFTAKFETEVRLSLMKQRCVFIDEHRCCVVCKRPIGDSVFGVFPNLKIAHFPCFKSATLDPERLVPFVAE